MTAPDPATVDPGYFRECYDSSPDPWGLADRWYEARKYAISLALLPRRHYDSAFEPGCSIGVLTAMLAPRCGSLLACDPIPGAVAAARKRTSEFPWVRVTRRAIPWDWPGVDADADSGARAGAWAGGGGFDLIVFSEILYYFGDEDLSLVLRQAVRALAPDGHLLAVHWRHPAPEHARPGDEVHQVLREFGALARLAGYRDGDFIAEVFTHADGDLKSVAQADGIV